MLEPAEVIGFRSALERLEQCFGGAPKGHDLNQSHLHFGWAYRLATHPRILDAVEQLLGPDVLIHSSTIFKKRPYEGTYVSWHQDTYFMRLDKPDLVSAWVALSDSNRENGCLRVVRGSHRRGNLAHTDSAISERNLLSSGLEIAVAVEESEATDVILRAGQMSLHHANIVHGSNANYSAQERCGFAIRYVAPHVRQSTPHHPVMLARGEDRCGHYRVKTAIPDDDLERGLAAQSAFSRELRAQRLAMGRKG